MSVDTPFDRRLRRVRRDRAAPRFAETDYLHAAAVDELLDRLSDVKRRFTRALVIGAQGSLPSRLRASGLHVVAADPGFVFASAACGVQCDEDRLPFSDGAFDLVVAVGTLDTVNDLPGALLLIQRALAADGLFLAGLAGAGTLPRLKAALLSGDAPAAPRVHPQIDVRAAGDLLARAGFSLPVADVESVDVRFPDLATLVTDLRAMAATNVLMPVPLSRGAWFSALEAFAAAKDADGKVRERFEILYLTGWS